MFPHISEPSPYDEDPKPGEIDMRELTEHQPQNTVSITPPYWKAGAAVLALVVAGILLEALWQSYATANRAKAYFVVDDRRSSYPYGYFSEKVDTGPFSTQVQCQRIGLAGRPRPGPDDTTFCEQMTLSLARKEWFAQYPMYWRTDP
jgi:hypothetical protein